MSIKEETRVGVEPAASALVLGLFGVHARAGTSLAWTRTTENENNTFPTGTVNISDSDGSTPWLSFAGGGPAQAFTWESRQQ